MRGADVRIGDTLRVRVYGNPMLVRVLSSETYTQNGRTCRRFRVANVRTGVPFKAALRPEQLRPIGE